MDLRDNFRHLKNQIRAVHHNLKESPGQVVKGGIASLAKNPITATAGTASTFIVGATCPPSVAAAYAANPVPVGAIAGSGIERGVKKFIPKYDALTRLAARKVRNSGTLNKILHTSNSDQPLSSIGNLRSIVQKGYSGDTMIKFKQKDYSIQEGHYTGPKDLENGVPGYMKTVGGGFLAGTAIGYGVDKGRDLLESTGVLPKTDSRTQDSPRISGVEVGGKAGIAAGLLSKIIMNSLHNPMSDVKFSEVDRNLRLRYGMCRVSGLMVGDTLENRNKMEEAFLINDRKVTDYKINIAIQNGKVTMYILKPTQDELDKIDKTLNYYCKKYYGMNYTSSIIGTSRGMSDTSYSVELTFTNYQVICDFLIELTKVLGTKINLLNSKAIVENKLYGEELEAGKTFSENLSIGGALTRFKNMSALETIEFLTSTVVPGVVKFAQRSIKLPSFFLRDIIFPGLSKLNERDPKLKVHPLKNLGSEYFLEAIKECGFVEGIDYEVDDPYSLFTMFMFRGEVYICFKSDTKEQRLFESQLYKGDIENYRLHESGKGVTLYTFIPKSKADLKVFLTKVIKIAKIKPSIETR